MKPVVVVGSINMDLVSLTPKIPAPGQTVTGTDFQMHSGGKGANQAAAVARLGHRSILLGVTGDDIFGSQLRSTLSGYGVDVSHLGTAEGPSGIASIVVDAGGENTIIVTPGANRLVTDTYLESKVDVLLEAGIVLAQLEVPMKTIVWLANFCGQMEIPFMLDPAPAAEIPSETLRKVTWFTPNQTEASFYVNGEQNVDETVNQLLEAGVANVILKRGSAGSIISTGSGDTRLIPPFRVKAVDTTAAGDAFNGAFAVALLRGCSPEQSARFASAAAAISVGRLGAQTSLAANDETISLLNSGAPPTAH